MTNKILLKEFLSNVTNIKTFYHLCLFFFCFYFLNVFNYQIITNKNFIEKEANIQNFTSEKYFFNELDILVNEG